VVLGPLTRIPGTCIALLAVFSLERAFELALSRARLRTTRGSAASSDLEWTLLVLVHAGLLALPPIEAALLGSHAPPALVASALVAAGLAQVLRYWSVASLGPAWNARAVVDPAHGVVERGPYRWVRHPNYLAVLVEFSAVPLAFGAWRSWIVLNLLHLPLIVRRIRAEERLLQGVPGYGERMAGKGRFLPRLSHRLGV
jgi:methyltransferase